MSKYIFQARSKGRGELVRGWLIHVGDYCCILELNTDEKPWDSWDAPYLDPETGNIDGNATPVDPNTIELCISV